MTALRGTGVRSSPSSFIHQPLPHRLLLRLGRLGNSQAIFISGAIGSNVNGTYEPTRGNEKKERDSAVQNVRLTTEKKEEAGKDEQRRRETGDGPSVSLLPLQQGPEVRYGVRLLWASGTRNPNAAFPGTDFLIWV